MSKAEGCIVSGACRGKRKQQPNDKANNGRTGDGESVLPDHERETARGEANDEGAERTYSILICVEPRYHADEKWQRMDSKREQCPTEDTESDDVEKNADNEHGDGSRDRGCSGRAFHHHHGAIPRVSRSRGRLESPAVLRASKIPAWKRCDERPAQIAVAA